MKRQLCWICAKSTNKKRCCWVKDGQLPAGVEIDSDGFIVNCPNFEEECVINKQLFMKD